MSSKQEWLDYFEMINGRKPTLAEFEAAKKSKEFTESIPNQSAHVGAQPVKENIGDFASSAARIHVSAEDSKPDKSIKGIGISATVILGVILGAILLFVVVGKLTGIGKTSIINSQSVQIKGFDGQGTAMINQTVYQTERKVLAQKAGFTESEAEQITSGNGASLLTDNPDKTAKYNQYISKVRISIDTSTGLSDGDTVTLTVKSTDSSIPIKSETKDFTASDLGSTSDISNLTDLFEEAGSTFDVENDHISGAYFNFSYNTYTDNYTVTMTCSIFDSDDLSDGYWYRTASVPMSNDYSFDVYSLSNYSDSTHYSTESEMKDAIKKFYPNAVYLRNSN
ncbi:MAG: hypothetical protein LBV19_05835 [Streptococcaceae bacterium]|jgi:hypothetical protein|nr:hypothetical protein [Streptococcaceae bacterium]